MSITGVETLVYGVDDVAASARFFEDFGLDRVAAGVDTEVSLEALVAGLAT